MSSEAITKFLQALREDLSDRRLLPLVALVAAGLLAALVFVFTAGSSSPATPPEATVAPLTKPGLPVSEAAGSSTQPLAETVNGTADQRQGSSRDPFAPLPGAAGAKATSPSTATSVTSATSASSAGSNTPKSSGSTPSKSESTPSSVTPLPAKKEKVLIRYTTSAEFGVVPPTAEGAAPVPAALKPYPALKINEPLPAENPQLVYLGVLLRTGKAAVFALTGEAILHGAGKCVPSTTHCQGVELAPGQDETLDTVSATGQPVTYELKLVAIKKSVTTASGAAAVSPTGSQLLRNNGLLPIGGLNFSAQAGMLAAARG